jgi:hypothetical protein
MSAKEIDLTTEQMAEDSIKRFASWGVEPSGDWQALGTVHHHCTAAAFQSSVDKADEQRQDGLHITVGNMDANRHSLDSRFYVTKKKFQPDMSYFWDIDAELASVPEWARNMWPDDVRHKIASMMMGVPAKAEAVFPDEWKDNFIFKKIEPVQMIRHHGVYGGNGEFAHISAMGGGYAYDMLARGRPDTDFDFKKAGEFIEAIMEANMQLGQEGSLEDLRMILETWQEFGPVSEELITLFHACDVTLAGMIRFLDSEIVIEAREAALMENGALEKGNAEGMSQETRDYLSEAREAALMENGALEKGNAEGMSQETRDYLSQ